MTGARPSPSDPVAELGAWIEEARAEGPESKLSGDDPDQGRDDAPADLEQAAV